MANLIRREVCVNLLLSFNWPDAPAWAVPSFVFALTSLVCALVALIREIKKR